MSSVSIGCKMVVAEIISDESTFIFFDDGTYHIIRPDGNLRKISWWKLESGMFYYRHDTEELWHVVDVKRCGETDKEIVIKLLAAIDKAIDNSLLEDEE